MIWPENSTDIDPMQYPPVYEEIASAAAAIGRPILVGAVLQNPQRNAGVLWLPGKGPTTIYAKRRLVPFGEYIPFRSLISKITSLTQLQPTDFVPGHQTVVFDVGQIKLGDVICYEVGFDDLVRSEVAAGANLLSVQSNDATFEREGPTTAESGQQLAMARIRAVEFDRAVVVASTTGYSAIVGAGRPADLAQRHVAAGRARGARPAAHLHHPGRAARRLAGVGDRRGDRPRARPRDRAGRRLPAPGAPAPFRRQPGRHRRRPINWTFPANPRVHSPATAPLVSATRPG